MPSHNRPGSVVIVGASVAGLAAAETLRQYGYEGAITVVGDEEQAFYDRPPLSKEILSGEWTADQVGLRPPEQIAALRLDVKHETAVSVDPTARSIALDNGTTIEWDSLIVATGVRARRLPGGGRTLRTLSDSLDLRKRLRPGKRLVVVGGGFLGSEVASVARILGMDVCLVEPMPVPLASAVGVDIGHMLTETHRAHGVDVRTGIGVAHVHDRGVELSDGTALEADETLVAVGSIPNTEWLADSGIPVGDGVICDEFNRAAPDVYAAGDVARWFNPLFGSSMRVEHRTHAAEQGRAVAWNILHPDAPKPFAPVPYFWSDQHGMRIQAYGQLRDPDEIAILAGSLAERRFLAGYRRGDSITGVLAVGASPKELRRLRADIAAGAQWSDVTSEVH